jgi:hypothetical protein
METLLARPRTTLALCVVLVAALVGLTAGILVPSTAIAHTTPSSHAKATARANPKSLILVTSMTTRVALQGKGALRGRTVAVEFSYLKSACPYPAPAPSQSNNFGLGSNPGCAIWDAQHPGVQTVVRKVRFRLAACTVIAAPMGFAILPNATVSVTSPAFTAKGKRYSALNVTQWGTQADQPPCAAASKPTPPTPKAPPGNNFTGSYTPPAGATATIGGVPFVGMALTCKVTGTAAVPSGFRWFQGIASTGSAIAGATGQTYTVVAGDVGHTIYCEADLSDGSSVSSFPALVTGSQPS